MRITATHAGVVYVTLTAVAQVLVYTRVVCPGCGRWLLLIPGEFDAHVVDVAGVRGSSGTGIVTTCSRCLSCVEIMERAPRARAS